MSEIKPFKIEIADEDINKLRSRIESTRWPEKETVNDWNQGTPLSYMKEVSEYWINNYNWKEREKYYNSFDQYITTIDELDIHFVHVKSEIENATPLIMSHGWPGSIVEFHKIIRPLVDPLNYGGKKEDAFHVVCPTLPGYGFSIASLVGGAKGMLTCSPKQLPLFCFPIAIVMAEPQSPP